MKPSDLIDEQATHLRELAQVLANVDLVPESTEVLRMALRLDFIARKARRQQQEEARRP